MESTAIEYRKGPLGYAVLKDGKPVGSIRKRGMGWWLVTLPGPFLKGCRNEREARAVVSERLRK